jgi:protease-4
MKKSIILFLFVFSTATAFSQRGFLTYYELSPVMQTSPGAFKFGLYGFENPAITSYLHASDLQFSYWNKDVNGTRPWGLFFGNPYNGFGLLKSTDGPHSVIDYRYSIAFGSTKFALGVNYGFVGGDKAYFKRSNTLGWGALIRPNPYISIGAWQTYALDFNDFESVADVAIRPFGDKYPLALFADASLFNNQSIDKALWSAGVSWELIEGVRLNARYFSTKGFSVGADLSFGNIGVAFNQMYDQNGKSGNGASSVRLGALDRTIFPELNPEKRFLKLDINGEIKYRKNLLFDNSTTLLEIINKIEIYKKFLSCKPHPHSAPACSVLRHDGDRSV